MTNVTGFLIRTSLNDTGTLPRSGDWTGCPDIVPMGIKTMSRNQLVSSYGSAFNETLTQGLTNNIYVRAKNMNATPLTQKVWLFQVPGSLVLSPQTWYKWNNLVGYDAKNPKYDPKNPDTGPKIIQEQGRVISADPGQIAATDAFAWIPDSTEHHCLVAVAANSWPDVLKGIPSLPVNSIEDLARWIYGNGSLGWHNVDIKPFPVGTYENQTSYLNDGNDALITFTMIANNVPVGARISFSSNTSTKSGEIIGQDWATVTAPAGGGNINPDFELGTARLVEKNYKAILTYRTDFNGQQPPPGFKMGLKASVDTAPPAAKNARMAAFQAADSPKRSYLRSHSANAVFKDASGKEYGRGFDGYRSMMAAARGNLPRTRAAARTSFFGGDDDDLGNTVTIVVGTHSTQGPTSGA